jgi:hypothetical protein
MVVEREIRPIKRIQIPSKKTQRDLAYQLFMRLMKGGLDPSTDLVLYSIDSKGEN